MTGAVGCIALFLLPFAGVGVFAAVQAVRMAMLGDWGQAAFFGLFAITFGGVGVGGLVALARGRRRLADAEAAKARHPEEPWLWRADWAAGRIEDSNRTAARFAWVFAAFWNLVSLPAGYFGVRAAVEQGNRAGLVALLFPVAGVGLLIWATRISARLRRFGVSRLELETRPAAVGRSLSPRTWHQHLAPHQPGTRPLHGETDAPAPRSRLHDDPFETAMAVGPCVANVGAPPPPPLGPAAASADSPVN